GPCGGCRHTTGRGSVRERGLCDPRAPGRGCAFPADFAVPERTAVTDGLASFTLYEKILKGERERDQPTLAHVELKLSGLGTRDDAGILRPRNSIYGRLFILDWARKTRPKQEVRRYRRFAYAATAVVVLGVIGFVIYYQRTVVPLEEQQAARKALEDLRVTLS